MKIYKVGDKSKGLCHQCESLMTTTFKLCSVGLSSGKGEVDNILAAHCDECNHLVSIPQQSAPRIRETIKHKRHSIEVRLPRQLLDILFLVGSQFEIENPDLLRDTLIRYYIVQASSSSTLANKLKKYSRSELSAGSDFRLSLKVSDAIHERFQKLLSKTSLSKTELIKALILQMNEDILQKPVKKTLEQLKIVLLSAAA